jgi:hypothetical protein
MPRTRREEEEKGRRKGDSHQIWISWDGNTTFNYLSFLDLVAVTNGTAACGVGT